MPAMVFILREVGKIICVMFICEKRSVLLDPISSIAMIITVKAIWASVVISSGYVKHEGRQLPSTLDNEIERIVGVFWSRKLHP